MTRSAPRPSVSSRMTLRGLLCGYRSGGRPRRPFPDSAEKPSSRREKLSRHRAPWRPERRSGLEARVQSRRPVRHNISPDRFKPVEHAPQVGDQGSFIKRDPIGNRVDGIHMVDYILGEPSVGGKSVRPVSFLPVVQASRVMAQPAIATAETSQVRLHSYPVSNFEFVDAFAQGHNRSRIFMAGYETSVGGLSRPGLGD